MDINNVSLQLGSSLHVQPRSHAPIKGDSSSADAQANINAKHSVDDAQKSTPNFTISKSTTLGVEPTEEELRASNIRMLDIFIRELPKAAEELSGRLETIEGIIADKVPSSIDKIWDFTIDEDGSAVVVGDKLSDDEKEKIADIIDSSGIGENLSKTRDLMMEGLQEDRTVALYSTNIGKYELNEQNFSEVIYFKEYLSKADKGSAAESLASQLNARAHEVYNKKETIDVYV